MRHPNYNNTMFKCGIPLSATTWNILDHALRPHDKSLPRVDPWSSNRNQRLGFWQCWYFSVGISEVNFLEISVAILLLQKTIGLYCIWRMSSQKWTEVQWSVTAYSIYLTVSKTEVTYGGEVMDQIIPTCSTLFIILREPPSWPCRNIRHFRNDGSQSIGSATMWPFFLQLYAINPWTSDSSDVTVEIAWSEAVTQPAPDVQSCDKATVVWVQKTETLSRRNNRFTKQRESVTFAIADVDSIVWRSYSINFYYSVEFDFLAETISMVPSVFGFTE